jgi:metal-dependent amidase/aminoacylase/carboxypeptidase family protein
MVPTLAWVAGADRLGPPVMASEDFSFFAQQAHGLFFWVGITPPDQDPQRAASNHSRYSKWTKQGYCRACEACCI